MTKLAEYIAITRQMVREANATIQFSMEDNVYESFVRRALRRYSIDKPDEKVVAITGTASQYITVNTSNLPDFLEGFSSVINIEARAPTIASNEEPNYLERAEWDFYRDDSAYRIFLKNHKPTSNDTIRVSYTIIHTIDGLDSATADTVPDQDREAVIYWAINEAFMALAGKYAGSSDPTIRQDVVNYKTKSSEMRETAKEYRTMYKEWISDPLKPASVIRDIDFGFGFGDNQPFQTHRSYSRN
tara:strand:- start:1324 stop:2055 length:732 start_codon:yes stop_codon:yes gene_type:complete